MGKQLKIVISQTILCALQFYDIFSICIYVEQHCSAIINFSDDTQDC